MIPGGEAPYDSSNAPWLELGVEEGPPPELLELGPVKRKGNVDSRNKSTKELPKNGGVPFQTYGYG
eukprot:4272078-Prymnesium_polylepis.1